MGLVSWSNKDVDRPCTTLPGVLTDVSVVRPWIDAALRALTVPLTGSGEQAAGQLDGAPALLLLVALARPRC